MPPAFSQIGYTEVPRCGPFGLFFCAVCADGILPKWFPKPGLSCGRPFHRLVSSAEAGASAASGGSGCAFTTTEGPRGTEVRLHHNTRKLCQLFHRRLLPARRERPSRRRAEEQHDELAASHVEHRASSPGRRSVYRTLNLPQRGWQILGEHLNCSESRRGAAGPLPCRHTMRQAALRNYNPAYVRFGSFSSERHGSAARGMSASLQKQASERLPCYVRLVPKPAQCTAAKTAATAIRSPRRQV
jgi:hypothetical protein